MDHTFANETYAAERYLLGEMTPEERDAFEEHFFSCRACGEDIQTGSVFLENAKTVFGEEARKAAPAAKREWHWDWIKRLRLPVAVPALAALALGGVVVYQDTVVIPPLKAPQNMAEPLILDGETRSTRPEKESGKPLRFQMVLPHTPNGDRVLVEIVNSSGTTMFHGSLAAPDVDQPVDVFFPGRLKPGRYDLIARSAQGENAGEELARNSFSIIEPLNIPTQIVTPPPRSIDGAPPKKGDSGR